ncbi:MAG: Radical SAM superfamily protein [Promethearchaeota archaeon]|nr:MAG: Radical SAM superfamily protein [Candidatus Lokiarchaeota archaeon]
MVNYVYKEYKTALNKLKFPDSYFWCRYTLNPYAGCTHACIYCDARSNRYYLENFEEDVIIKQNIAKKLELTIKNSRSLLLDVIGPGGVCDAYQPIEKKIENTREVLKVLAKYKFPVNIATKSDLIVRDIDLLKRIATDTWCTVGFSITTTDEKLAGVLEPFSSSPQKRLEAMRQIKKSVPEIQIGTYFMPIIPFLEDSDENLEDVIKQTKNYKGNFVLFAPGLTLRDDQKAYFIRKLKNSKYRKVTDQLLNLYKGQYQSKQMKEYVTTQYKKLFTFSKKYSMNIRQKRWIPSDYRKWNYIIAEKLLNEEYINSIQGKPNSKMKWAGLYLNNLEESIIEVYRRDELYTLRNFDSQIVDFIKDELKKGKKERDKKTLDRFL